MPSNPGTDARPDTTPQGEEVSLGLRVAAVVLRSIFGIALVAMVAHVSLPQNESMWTVYDTPGDLVRLALGFLASVWIVFHMFMLPKDAQGYRTWVYLGTALVPLTLAALFAVW